MIDQTGVPCEKCVVGEYRETSVMDDISGVLHCSECGFQVKRWVPESTESDPTI